MQVRKAVIPAAGLGTRVLPITKALPKEMLPIVDKPAIQYIVEEAVASGIEQILIITSRGKSIMEDHFDRSPELEARLLAGGKREAYDEVVGIAELASISYLRQGETKGLGHAVLMAKSFVGDEPFAVLFGDDVILGSTPATGELIAAYNRYGKGVAGIKEVPHGHIHRYSSLAVSELEPGIFSIADMIEKPAPGKELSCYSILGRCVLPPQVFDILEHTGPGAGGEIQLTDALRVLSHRGDMIGVAYSGTRYDMGDKLGILKATVETALTHPTLGGDFTAYLKSLNL